MSIQIHDDFLLEGQMEALETIISQGPQVLLYLDEGVAMNASPSPEWLEEYLQDELEAREGRPVSIVVSFLRMNSSRHDTEERVHCDFEILGEHPDRAAVLYLTDIPEKFPARTGTAFWGHFDYGSHFEGTNEEAQEILKDCSRTDYDFDFLVSHHKNRLVTYPCNRFHSRYPAKAWGREGKEDSRWVVVVFYNVDTKEFS